jgi:hypothetical protein
MNAWIEVSSEYRFRKKQDGICGLYAPAGTRHINQLKQIRSGDVVLHYITIPGAINKENVSSIIGISIVSSSPIVNASRITVPLKETVELPVKVNINELRTIKKPSIYLKTLLDMKLQRYLSQITSEDFINILSIHEENKKYLKIK